MKEQEHIRAVIVSGLRAQMSAKDIINAHKIKKSTVYHVKSKFEAFVAAGESPESFDISRKKHKRRSDCKAAAIAEDVENINRRDSSKSMRAIAAQLKVSKLKIRRTTKEEHHYKPFSMKKGQFMSEATKNRRICVRGKRMDKQRRLSDSFCGTKLALIMNFDIRLQSFGLFFLGRL